MAKAREIPGLDADTPFREAAARTVEVRTGELFGFAEGVLDTADIERVHDMRVATRRLRAAMEVFVECFPKKPHRRALREVKGLADALGARRDPDVQIAALERTGAALGREARPGIDGLVEEFRDRQSAANDALETALERVQRTDLEGQLLALADSARSVAVP